MMVSIAKVCKIIAFQAISRGSGLFFCLLFGFRQDPPGPDSGFSPAASVTLPIRRDPTWTPKVCKKWPKASKNSLRGHCSTHSWGPGTADLANLTPSLLSIRIYAFCIDSGGAAVFSLCWGLSDTGLLPFWFSLRRRTSPTSELCMASC